MVSLFDDDAIRARLSPSDAVRWMGEAVDAHHRGELVAPPRAHVDLAGGRLMFTVGRLHGSWYGYRSYDTLPSEPGSQVVVVHDEATGRVRAIAVGNELGPRRTGAIGGLAADVLARRSASVAAVIGTGTQAETQLWALAAVREFREVRVHSRDPARRRAFAQRARSLTDATLIDTATARDAVDGADIVVLATGSPTPVIQAGWLVPDAYVTTLGPKQQGRAEFGLDLPAAASHLVTDSVDQIDAYAPPSVLAGTPYRARLLTLGAVRAGGANSSHSGGITVFFSVGLAGTEVFLLDRIDAAAAE